MIVETIQRVQTKTKGIRFANPLIIANAAHEALIADQLAQAGIAADEIILEPIGRNTAATAVLAALAAEARDPEALVLLLPADHLIADAKGFRQAIAAAAPYARDRIVTFGITPTGPDTGYGYIQAGKALGDEVRTIKAFKEKPDRATAKRYLKDGNYAWNAGIFLFSPQVLLEEFGASAPIRDLTAKAYRAAARQGIVTRLDAKAFGKVPSSPVDVAVMEQTKKGAVLPCAVGWADVGSWSEVWRISPADGDGNVRKGRTVAQDVTGSLIMSEGPVVAVAGVKDLIVVATKDAVLIVPKDRAQDVKALWQQAKDL
jgi:mannose-1-phosphate guanylyltransferase/mannose-6-phosphate isomerase